MNDPEGVDIYAFCSVFYLYQLFLHNVTFLYVIGDAWLHVHT